MAIESDGYVLGFTLKNKKTLTDTRVDLPEQTKEEMEIMPDSGVEAEETAAEGEVSEEAKTSLIDEDAAEQTDTENNGNVIITSFASGIVDEVNAVSAEVVQVNDASGQSVVSENIQNEEAVPEESMSTLPEHLDSAATYTSIFSNVDLRYDLAPDSLKESIVLNQLPAGQEMYTFQLRAEGMVLENTIDGIYAYSSLDEGGKPPADILYAGTFHGR